MEDKQQLGDLIAQYIRGELIGSELISFENKLAESTELQEQVAIERAAFDVLLDADVLDLKELMQADLKPKESPSKKKYWLLGLGVLLIGAASYFGLKEEESVQQITNQEQDVVVKESLQTKKKEEVVPEVIDEIVEKETLQVSNQKREINKAIKSDSVVDKQEEVVPTIELVKVEEITKEEKQEEEGVPVKNEIEAVIPAQVVIKDKCADLMFSGSLKTKASLKGESTGRIYLDDDLVSGGETPYVYSINNENFSFVEEIDALAAGSYYLYVQDNNGCIAKNVTSVTINETSCIDDYTPTFNMAYESVWKVPVYPDVPVKITLVNKVGKRLVDKGFQSYEKGEWNGYDDNGNRIPTGAYKWIIEYQSGETCIAKMTILN